jgi:hypothetical protein
MKSRPHLLHTASLWPLVLAVGLLAACAPKTQYIAGTKITPSSENRGVIVQVEAYRVAVEEKDAAGILLMASRQYWEDSGTPEADDDYGFAGLKELLGSRFNLVDSIRYSMRYMRIRYSQETESEPRRAFVDVMVDASFSIPNPDARGGTRRADKRDQSQFVLEWTGDKWLFLSGM